KVDERAATLDDAVDTLTWKPNFTAAANEDPKGYHSLLADVVLALAGRQTPAPTIRDGAVAMERLETLGRELALCRSERTMKTPVIPFGSSRFLQAHADLFLSEGEPARAITVVQTSGDAARSHRLAALAAPEGYPVRVRGLKDGRPVDEVTTVISV